MLILKAKYPWDIFTKENYKKEYREMSRVYHPDKAGNNDIMQHINHLYCEAQKYEKAGIWGVAGEFKTIAGKQVIIKKEHQFELGKQYIMSDFVIYEVHNKEYIERFKQIVNMFSFANDKMMFDIKILLPYKVDYVENFIIINKTADVHCLLDVYNHFNGKIEEKHCVWIISSILNLLCYFEYLGIVINGIDMNNVFVSPEYHSGLLLGGYWHANKINKQLKSTSKEIFNVIPPKVRDSKICKHINDVESAKLIARKLFQDRTGKNLQCNKLIADWCNSIGFESPLKEYELWQELIVKAYGKREFLIMNCEI